MMSRDAAGLTAKESVGYEVFIFTLIYGLYNLFFSNPVLVDAVVFGVLLGSLFIRYHLVVSDESPSDSRAARVTGTLMVGGGVATVSFLLFQALSLATMNLDATVADALVFLGALAVAIVAVTLVNHPVFRSDSQRRRAFRENLDDDGIAGILSRVGLYLDSEAERVNFDAESNHILDKEEQKRLYRMAREGEIETHERDEFRRAIETNRKVLHILMTAFHALFAVSILIGFTVLMIIFSPSVSLDIFSLLIVVSGVYYCFLMLNIRFGLRRRVQRSPWKMPAELILSMIFAHLALFNADLVGGGSIIVVIPFMFILLTARGFSLTQRLFLWMAQHLIDSPDELDGRLEDFGKRGDSS